MLAIFFDVKEKEKCDENFVKNLFLTCSDAGFLADVPASLHKSAINVTDCVRDARFWPDFPASLRENT